VARLFVIMAGALASHADAFAVHVQQDRDRNKHAGEKCKEGARPANAEVDIHRLREERKRGAEHGSNKVISGKNARGIGRICVRKVIQDGVLCRENETSVFDAENKRSERATHEKK
jgi:hypothetical protein